MAEQLHKEFLKGVKFLRENKVFEGLPPEEVKETKKRIKEVNDQILGLEKKLREYETKKALSLEEAELAAIAQGVRDSSGKVRNTMMDLFSGIVRLGSTMPARVAGYGAHVVGAEETGKKLTQFAEDKDTSFEMIAPPAGADAGLVETIVSAGARSLAPSLMTGAVGAGVAGAIGKIPAVATAIGESAKLAGRIDTAARLFATTATMSADEVLRSSTKTDEMGGVVLPENALPVMAGTLAHAAIENVAGITPFKMISQTKFANKFLNREGVRAIRTGIKKLGLKGAIGEFVKETVGEGAEEYMQGITEDVTAIFAHAPSITEAVQASYELIADWDYHKGKSREFVVGAGVGALYSGMFRARAVIENKHASIEQKKEAMALLESARAAKEELKIVQQHLETMMEAKAEIARAELDDLQDRLRESGIKRYGDVQQLREELYNIVEKGSRSEQPRDLEVYEGEGEAESVPYVEAEEVDAVWEDLIAELRAARDRVELEDKQLVPVEDVATKGEPAQELGRIAAPEEKKLIGEPKRKLIGGPKRKLIGEPKRKLIGEPKRKLIGEPEVKPEPEVKAEQEDIKGRAAAEIRASDKTAAEKAEPEVKPVEVEQHVADTIDGWKIERRKTFNKRQYKTFLEGETLGAHGKVIVTDDGGVTNSKFAIFGNATDPELFKLFKENSKFANPVPRKVLQKLQSEPINCTNFKYEYTENARGKKPVIVYSAEFEGERIYLRGNEHVYRYLKNRIPDLGIEAHAQREDATIAYFKDGKGEIVAMEILMPERASEYQTSAKSISEALDGGYKKPESEKKFTLKKAEREFLRAFRPSERIGSVLRTSPSGDITDGKFIIKGKYVPEEMRKAANSERYNDGGITDEKIGGVTKNLEDGEHEPTVVGERKLPDSKDTEVVLKYQGTWNRPTAYASVLKPVLDYLGGLSEDTKMTVTPQGMLIFRSADGDLQAVAMTRSIEDATVGEGYADKVKERREQQEAEERELAKKRKELEQEKEAKARAEQERKRQEELAEEDEEFQGFLKGKTTLQRANAVKTLQLHGRKEYIDNLHRRGLLGIGTHEENKIKDPSRRTYNRWGWEQQQEHERRVREAGKKTVYEIRDTSTKNLYREATKTEYEYAKHLLEKAKSGEKIEDFGEKIGGARKDTADRGYKRGRIGENKDKDIPAWRKRYTVSEILAGNDKGKFAIFDANNKLPYSAMSMTFNTREAATMALPLVVVSLKHSVHSSKENRSEYSIYRKITQGLYPIKDGFKSAEEAKRYMVQNAVEIIETKVRNYGESDLLLANEPKRVGATRKTNVTTKDFADTFGFRGVEFGNWNNQSERQNVMDYAYAALQDLAEILKIPDKAISLNGELALAFGARGRGLTGARAHYEQYYKVINLTKMKGAGALAHEWFHALDHYLARQDKRGGMLTEKQFKHPKDETKIRDELREVFEKVVSVISKKVVDVESEEASRRTKFLKERVVDKVKAYNNEVQTLRKYFAEPHEYDKRKKYADKQELEKFDKLIKEAANSEIDWIPIPSDLTQKVRFAYGNEALFDLSRLIKKVRGRSEITEGGKLDKLGRLLEGVRMAKENVETDAKGANKTKTISTDFYLEARELDRYRTTPYWSEVAEMAARAFSSYVEDKLGSAKQVSDFLSYGSQNKPYHKLFHGGKPFPEGAERVAINKALDDLFSEFKTKETESGIKLYSIEYLAVKYAVKGLKQAAKVVRRGIEIFAFSSRVKNLASSTKHFAQWARQMVNEFGQNVKKHLRGLYKELQNPTYSSRPRMGAISAKDVNWGQKRELARKRVAEGKGLSLDRLEGESLQEWGERSIASSQVIAEMNAADDAREAEIGKPVRAPSKSKLEAERKAKEKRIEAEAKSTAAIIMAAHKRTEKAAAEAKKALEKARAYIQEGREREAKLAKAIEEATPKTVMDSWRKALDNAVDLLADQWAPIKRLQEAVEETTGQKLTDDYNVYKLIETVQGRKSEHIKEVEGKYYDPIVNGLIKAKILLSDFNEYLYARAAFARNRMIAKRPGNPFALTGEPGSGMSDKEAQSIIDKVAKLPNAAEYAAIAEQVYALNNFLLDEQVRLGLIKPQARDAYRKFGKDYVPLKRPPEHGFILDRSALGRRSKASNHLEYINQAITATYTRAFNREINLAVIKLFELTEQPLLYSKVKPKRVLVKGKKKDVIKVETEKFIGKDEYVWQRTGKNDYIVYKIHDEGLRHAIKGAKVTDSIGSKILNVFATNNKWIAFTATGGNPEFLLKNPIRDIQQAMAYTATHISFGSAAKFPKHLAQASSILTEHSLTGKEKELLRAFKLGGGLVGYSEFYSIEQQAKDLDKTIRDGIKGGVVYMSGEAVKKAVGVIAKWNSTLETLTKFAAYLNAKEAGLTELSAIAHAKNVTVNFNKKGTMGHILNSLYVFAGANLGGNLNTAQILKKAMQTRKGQVMVAGAIALGAALEMLNYNIAGEDDDGVNYYDKIPNYVKDLSYVFMIPGTKGKYIAIPMPYGLAMLPAFGRNMAAYYRGGQHVGKTVANLYSAFMDSFNPLGGDERGLLSDAVPSAIKPFFDVWSNTKWTGKQLRPEQDVFGSEVAISELTYPSDSKAAKEFAKWLNEVSGGDRYNSGWATYFSPGELDHLVLSYTGGLGRFIKRSADLLVKDKDEIELKEIPVSRVFYGEPGEYSAHQTFRENVELVRKYRRAVSEGDRVGMKKMGHLKKADDLLRDTERRIRHVRKVNKDQKKRDKYELALRKNFNKKMRNFNK